MTKTKTNYLLLAKNLFARLQPSQGGAQSDPYAGVAAFDNLVTATDSLNDPLPAARVTALEQIAQIAQTHPKFFSGSNQFGNAVTAKVRTIAATDADAQVQHQASQLCTVLEIPRQKKVRKFHFAPYPLAR